MGHLAAQSLPRSSMLTVLDAGIWKCIDLRQWGHRFATAVSSWILESALLAGAVHLVWGINMPLKTKAKVVIASACRLLLIPPSASRLGPMHSSVFNPAAASIVRLQVMSILACQVSVISATIPCAKPFFSVFTSGILGRPRASILPTSRPTMQREMSGPARPGYNRDRDRGYSIHRLDMNPERGITFASAEHVPVMPRAQRPSLVSSKHSKRSDNSITYTKEFEVSFQDVGGLLDAQERNSAELPTSKCRGSLPWGRSSGGKSSQKSNAGSSQHARHAPDA